MKVSELKEYTIPFIGLKIGTHHFDHQIERAFFEHFEYQEFDQADIALQVVMEKKNTMLEFDLAFEGTVNVLCDLTSEPYDQPVSGTYHFVVKFGEEYNDENDELLILPHGSHEVNIQQQVYESIVLAVPARRVHPGVKDGTLKSDILDKLEELSPGEQSGQDDSATDPRWDDLKKLLTDK